MTLTAYISVLLHCYCTCAPHTFSLTWTVSAGLHYLPATPNNIVIASALGHNMCMSLMGRKIITVICTQVHCMRLVTAHEISV